MFDEVLLEEPGGLLGLAFGDQAVVFGDELIDGGSGSLRGMVTGGVTRAGTVVPVEATTRATSVWTRVSKSVWDA